LKTHNRRTHYIVCVVTLYSSIIYIYRVRLFGVLCVRLRWYKYNSRTYTRYLYLLYDDFSRASGGPTFATIKITLIYRRPRICLSVCGGHADWSVDDTSSGCLSCTTATTGQCARLSLLVINYLPFSHYTHTSMSYYCTQKNTAANSSTRHNASRLYTQCFVRIVYNF